MKFLLQLALRLLTSLTRPPVPRLVPIPIRADRHPRGAFDRRHGHHHRRR